MNDIPKDIMDKAHLIWQDANTVNGVFTGDGQSSKYIPIIARAIFAERERCAKIAEGYKEDKGEWAIQKQRSRDIAAVIRDGRPVGDSKA